MARSNIGNLSGLLSQAFRSDDGLKLFLREMVQELMHSEVGRHVNAAPHERSELRHGYRNGSKPRRLRTRVGDLELDVPQVRGCEPYNPSLFNKWQRSERALLVACGEMYFQGVSTRNVRRVLEALCDGEVSAMTVSRVAAELDEKLAEFRGRRLEAAHWPYLMIDARYEKVRVEGKVLSQAVLVVVGFTSEGRREVLHWSVGDSESEQCWSEVFRSLKDRGLGGVKLVVSDAHRGIRSALSRHFQGSAWQRCRVHFKREMGRKVSYKVLRELMSDLAGIYAGRERGECLRRGQEMGVKWECRCPGVSKMLTEGLEDTLAVCSLPEPHRRKLASTNLLENMMKRLKKRTRVVGIFPNRASCDRLIGSQLMELHERWQTEERNYFNMEQDDSSTACAGA
jgi:putative transposase